MPQEDATPPAAAAFRGSAGIRRWAPPAVGIVLLGVLLSQVSLGDLAAVARRAHPGYLAAAFLCGLSATLLRAVRFGLFFPPERGWVFLYAAFGIVRVLNVSMPLRTGEIASLAALKRFRLSPSIAETAPTWIVVRVMDAAAMFGWLLLALSLHAFDVRLATAAKAALAFILVATIVAVLWARWGPGLPWHLLGGWVAGRMEKFRDGISHVRLVPLVAGSLIALVVWGALFLMGTLAQFGLGTPLSWEACFVAAAVAHSANLLPVHAPLGLGTADSVWVGIMSLFGLPLEQAISLSIGLRVVFISIVAVDGLLGFVLWSIWK